MRNIDPVEHASRFAFAELPITFNGRLQAPFVSEHKHEFDEIVLIVSGSGVHHTRFGAETVDAGTVLIIPEGEVHAYSESGSMVLHNCMIRFRHIPLPLGELYHHPAFTALFLSSRKSHDRAGSFPKVKLKGDDFRCAIEMLDRCNQEVQEQKLGWSLHCFGCFLQYLTLLLRNYDAPEKDADGIHQKLRQCLEYINNHPEQNCSIQYLCKRAGLSESTLFRWFKRTTGMSALEYQLALRMTRAANLLLEDRSLPISEVALQMGFNDSNYFAKLFRSRFNCSPREYRKLNSCPIPSAPEL
ncbi:MAG: helix-turn-helix domain-containing protein [Lentisphaerae bacterium]|nr:helix-turn-helix domain-containing protein [Lentisphaerota bacterium]